MQCCCHSMVYLSFLTESHYLVEICRNYHTQKKFPCHYLANPGCEVLGGTHWGGFFPFLDPGSRPGLVIIRLWITVGKDFVIYSKWHSLKCSVEMGSFSHPKLITSGNGHPTDITFNEAADITIKQ